MAITYNAEQDRLDIPESYTRPDYYDPNYEAIYEGCSEDVAKAFGQNDPKTGPRPTKSITSLSKKQKKEVIEKFKKNCRHSNGVIPGYGRKGFAVEFKKVLKEIAETKCFVIADAAGNEYGVTPPKGWYAQAGMVNVPWHLMYIDYSAQRWTDVVNVLKIILKFEAKCAYGVTARFSTDGTVVDVNEGRHGAMSIALTGAEFCWASGPVCDNLATNYDIFEIKNIVPKKTELYDEVRIKNSRTKHRLENGEDVRTEVGGNLEDQEAFDMSNLLEAFNSNFISKDKKKGWSGMDPHDMYRVDKLISWWQDPKFTVLKDGAIVDTYIKDALEVITDVYDDGHIPHEVMWGILELMVASQDNKKWIDDKTRSKMVTVLKDVLESNYSRADESNGFRRAGQFYKDFNQIRGNNHSGWDLAGYIKGNNYVSTFLATAIYSMIQESVGVRETDKALFNAPKINDNGRKFEIRDKDGDIFSFSKFLEENADTVDFDDFEELEDEVTA